MKLRQKLGEIIAKVDLRGEEFIIEKGGIPKAVIVPYRKIEMIRKRASKEVEEMFDEAAKKNPNADLSDDEVEAFVNQVIHESRNR